ncbi:MAG: isoprenylcysteine carboxylmethyltransferase family protein [Deltaproteobacteria bacterium]
MTTADNDNPGVIAMPPLIFIIFLAIGILINLLVPLSFIHGSARFISGIIILLVSGIIVLSAQRRMKRSGTNIDVRKPSTAVVTGGIYSYTRNPMYMSMVILLIALAFLLNNLWVLIVIPFFMAVIRKGVIMREEAYLERKFGSEYTEYKKRVRRWI